VSSTTPLSGSGTGMKSQSRQRNLAKQVVGKKKVFTAAQLIEKAEGFVEKCQPDIAIKFYERALKADANNTEVMDAMAEIYLDNEDQENALRLLTSSVTIAPDSSPSKWLYLAQLQEGAAALSSYTRGATMLGNAVKHYQDAGDKPGHDATVGQLVAAYVSIGELYMTDLCMEENAEAECERFIQLAISTDSESVEGLQALANIRVNQERDEEAAAALERACEKIEKLAKKRAETQTLLKMISGDAEQPEVDKMPNLPFRLQTAKLCMEVERHELAIPLFHGILEEDDSNIEIWFLVGLCCVKMDQLQPAYQYTMKAHEMFQKLKSQDFRGKEFPYQEHFEQVQQTLAELQTKMAAAGISVDDVQLEEGDEDEWETDEDGEEGMAD
jgi:tetratricopeptide (TPR) repeat protein